MVFSQMFCKTEYFEKYGKETFLKCLFFNTIEYYIALHSVQSMLERLAIIVIHAGLRREYYKQ